MNKSTKQQGYRVCIEETISQEFEIEAESWEEALEKARADYRAGELVLEAGDLHHVQMQVRELPEMGEAVPDPEWVEL